MALSVTAEITPTRTSIYGVAWRLYELFPESREIEVNITVCEIDEDGKTTNRAKTILLPALPFEFKGNNEEAVNSISLPRETISQMPDEEKDKFFAEAEGANAHMGNIIVRTRNWGGLVPMKILLTPAVSSSRYRNELDLSDKQLYNAAKRLPQDTQTPSKDAISAWTYTLKSNLTAIIIIGATAVAIVASFLALKPLKKILESRNSGLNQAAENVYDPVNFHRALEGKPPIKEEDPAPKPPEAAAAVPKPPEKDKKVSAGAQK